MKVVILAGGMGTRISEESDLKPKPMIEIGGKPILWHIMKIYSHYGFNDFIVCCGYKGYYIKDYFHHYYMHQADMTIDLGKNITEYHTSQSEPWRVTLIDTGLDTMTGGRVKRIREVYRWGEFHAHLRRRGGRCRHTGADRVPQEKRTSGDAHRRSAPRPLRRDRARGGE